MDVVKFLSVEKPKPMPQKITKPDKPPPDSALMKMVKKRDALEVKKKTKALKEMEESIRQKDEGF